MEDNYPKDYAEKLAEQYGHELDDAGNVITPGKFEGETWQVIDAYDTLQNGCEEESFGDTERFGFYFSAGIETGETIFAKIDSQGFVSEISAQAFESAREENSREAEREDAIEELAREIRTLERQEFGTCDSCEVLMINGTRSHELGCPRFEALRSKRAQLERLEDYY